MKRTLAREEVFLALFEMEFTKTTPQELMDTAIEVRGAAYDEYAKRLITAAVAHSDEVDTLIAKYSTAWKTNRLPKVTLAVLRLAITEILYMDDIPQNVTANEAVELAKKYGAPDDASYVNGILGTLIKDTNHPQA